MSSAVKPIKYKKVKTSVAENNFKEKYDETRWLLDHMGHDPNASLDKGLNRKKTKNLGKPQRYGS